MMTAQYCKVLQLQEGSGRILKIFFGCVFSVLGQGGSNAGDGTAATGNERETAGTGR
jgi:hypothetical protein